MVRREELQGATLGCNGQVALAYRANMTDEKQAKSKGTDAPMCKLCGHRHWGMDHVWGKPSSTSKKKSAKKKSKKKRSKASSRKKSSQSKS